jgi:hypothetical protein
MLRGTFIKLKPKSFDRSILVLPKSHLDQLYDCFKFRHQLADQFSSKLRKNAAKHASISFEMRASSLEINFLLSWPGLNLKATKMTFGKAQHRNSWIVYNKV